MLAIRLFRVGRKNQPSFKIVVTDRRKPPRAGRFVEEGGSWNPSTKEKAFKVERVKYWLSVGAKPSDTIFNLLVSEKIVEGKKIPVHKKSKKPFDAAQSKPAEAAVPAVASVPAPASVPAEELKKEETIDKNV